MYTSAHLIRQYLPLWLITSLIVALISTHTVKAANIEAWQQLITHYQQADDTTKLQVVNAFFNQIPYQADVTHWGQDDYWAQPAELITSNAGDCEDYAIAKYITLLKLGVSESKLRLTYVKILGGNLKNIKDMLSGKAQTAASINFDPDAAHIVLIYYPSSEATPLVLDNMTSAIQPATERHDLKPVYSFNDQNTWLKSAWTKPEILYGDADKVYTWKQFRNR